MAKQWHQLEKLDHKSLKKLQVDREKAVQALRSESEKKRIYIIIGAVIFGLLCVGFFFYTIRNRVAQREFKEARQVLMKSTVTDVQGVALGRTLGNWEKVSPGLVFDDEEYSFKTEKDGFLICELQLKNILKLASNSEMAVFRPKLDEKINKVIKEKCTLARGEVTIGIALDGRDILEIEAGGVVALGASGLYKVLYNSQKNTGEVVVKNGLVEVFSRKNPEKRVKVSGFYKVTFANGTIGSPTQASVIQYDWR